MEEIENVLVDVLQLLGKRYLDRPASDRVIAEMESTADHIFRNACRDAYRHLGVRIIHKMYDGAVDMVLIPKTQRGEQMLELLQKERTDDWVEAQKTE